MLDRRERRYHRARRKAPLMSSSPRVTFAQGRVESIDLARKSVSLTIGDAANGVPEEARTLAADHLVIALGSITADHHIPGVREHGLTVKSVGDAAAIRNRALELLDRADAEPDPATRRALNIVAAMRGEKPQPFVYTPIGELALVGKRSGVAQVYGLRFSGVLAWAMWRAVYLAKTPLPEKRIRILLDWTLDLLFGDKIAQLPTARSVSPAARDALQE